MLKKVLNIMIKNSGDIEVQISLDEILNTDGISDKLKASVGELKQLLNGGKVDSEVKSQASKLINKILYQSYGCNSVHSYRLKWLVTKAMVFVVSLLALPLGLLWSPHLIAINFKGERKLGTSFFPALLKSLANGLMFAIAIMLLGAMALPDKLKSHSKRFVNFKATQIKKIDRWGQVFNKKSPSGLIIHSKLVGKKDSSSKEGTEMYTDLTSEMEAVSNLLGSGVKLMLDDGDVTVEGIDGYIALQISMLPRLKADAMTFKLQKVKDAKPMSDVYKKAHRAVLEKIHKNYSTKLVDEKLSLNKLREEVIKLEKARLAKMGITLKNWKGGKLQTYLNTHTMQSTVFGGVSTGLKGHMGYHGGAAIVLVNKDNVADGKDVGFSQHGVKLSQGIDFGKPSFHHIDYKMSHENHTLMDKDVLESILKAHDEMQVKRYDNYRKDEKGVSYIKKYIVPNYMPGNFDCQFYLGLLASGIKLNHPVKSANTSESLLKNIVRCDDCGTQGMVKRILGGTSLTPVKGAGS